MGHWNKMIIKMGRKGIYAVPFWPIRDCKLICLLNHCGAECATMPHQKKTSRDLQCSNVFCRMFRIVGEEVRSLSPVSRSLGDSVPNDPSDTLARKKLTLILLTRLFDREEMRVGLMDGNRE
jgi:hypothetical protein